MLALQRRQALTQGGIAGRQLHFVAELGVQTLHFRPMAGQLGTFLRHRHFHVTHLLHKRLFVILELLALSFQLLT